MSCLSLNCRGLCNPSAVRNLRDLLRREAPSLVFLSETKLSSGEFYRIRDNLGDFHGLAVDSMGRSGGLALLWRKDIDVVLSSMSVHHIDVVVRRGVSDEEWRFTGFMVGRKFIIDICLGGYLRVLLLSHLFLGFVLVISMRYYF